MRAFSLFKFLSSRLILASSIIYLIVFWNIYCLTYCRYYYQQPLCPSVFKKMLSAKPYVSNAETQWKSPHVKIHNNIVQTLPRDCTSTLSKKLKLNAQVYVETYIEAELVTSFERPRRTHAAVSAPALNSIRFLRENAFVVGLPPLQPTVPQQKKPRGRPLPNSFANLQYFSQS